MFCLPYLTLLIDQPRLFYAITFDEHPTGTSGYGHGLMSDVSTMPVGRRRRSMISDQPLARTSPRPGSGGRRPHQRTKNAFMRIRDESNSKQLAVRQKVIIWRSTYQEPTFNTAMTLMSGRTHCQITDSRDLHCALPHLGISWLATVWSFTIGM